MATEVDDPLEFPEAGLTDSASALRIPNLPHEIIIEILSRLPVKVIVRFRCVCKSWRFLISKPHFIKKQLRVSAAADNIASHRLMVVTVDPRVYSPFRSCSLYSIYNEGFDTAMKLPPPTPMEELRCFDLHLVLGSCNGLVCIAFRFNEKHDILVLWNPATRESRRLPDSGSKYERVCSVVYGFGYDDSIDDYKVVAISDAFRSPSHGDGGHTIKVYTLRTNSWKRIQNFPFVAHNEPGRLVGGTLNWAAAASSVFCADLRLPCTIVGMDLATETFSVVPQPAWGAEEIWCHPALGEVGGCLCLLANYLGSRADLWVMKEYGNGDSWTKLFTIPYLEGSTFRGFPLYRPLCIFKNGELLLEFDSLLALYDPKHNTLRCPVIRNLIYCYEERIYVESLVSPNAEEGAH